MALAGGRGDSSCPFLTRFRNLISKSALVATVLVVFTPFLKLC